MKLSIIVPVYNAQDYLRRCLDSLANQSLDDYELLLIDDGSTDSSPQILAEYQVRYPEKIRILTVENGGQGRARNIGIEAAQGDYIGFADSDDWAELDMYETLYNAAVQEEADLVLCDAVEHPEGESQRLMSFSREENDLKATAVWNKLVKRELLGDIRFPENKIWYEDLPFSIKLVLSAEKIARVPRGLYHYRLGQTSTMNNNNTLKNLDMLTVLDDLKTWMLPRGFQDEFESIVLNHLLLDGIKRVNLQKTPEKKGVIRKFRAYVKEAIPDLGRCDSFRLESGNRQIIMRLNYMGQEDLAQTLLTMKRSL